MDVTPLRESRDFRLLFVAGTVFYFGAMVSYVAIPFQVYRLTGSNLLVGVIGIVELVPLLVFGLYGGALADHVDRRRLLIGCGVAQAVFTAVLGINAFRDEPSLPLIFVVSGLLAAASALPPEEIDRLTDDIIAALKTVYDPEIPSDIYELGLIYRVDIDDNREVAIDMTLTAPGCPVAGEMPGWVETAVSAVPGVQAARVNMVFDPPWDQSRMSDEARAALDMW